MFIQVLGRQFFALLSDFVWKISRFQGSIYYLIRVDLNAPFVESNIRISSFDPYFLHAAAKIIESEVCSSFRTLVLLIIILKVNTFVIIKIYNLFITLALRAYEINYQ